jgi:hypothetical protein
MVSLDVQLGDTFVGKQLPQVGIYLWLEEIIKLQALVSLP